MVTNSLTKLLTSNPSVGEEISKLSTKEEIFVVLKKHIDGYTEEQMIKDFSEVKASVEISKDGALDTEALENVAGGAGFMDWVNATAQAVTATISATMQTYQQTKNVVDQLKN
ncbi:MAG: hypothetical protein LBL38_00055 [Lactobacillales bacterium]|nr:hypothetical protein [Lactobacillales bacterium]